MRLPAWMRWHFPIFAHFEVPAARLEEHLPPGVRLDRHEGAAWLSLAALEATGPLPRFAAPLGERGLLRYRQINVRTYVLGEAGPGIALLHTWVDRALPAMSARMIGMRYRRMRPLTVEVEEGRAQIRGRGIDLEGRVQFDGRGVLAVEGTLEHFLLERYVAYGALPTGQPYALRIQHAPWRFYRVEWESCELSGVPLLERAGEPVVSHLGSDQEVLVVEATRFAEERQALSLELETP